MDLNKRPTQWNAFTICFVWSVLYFRILLTLYVVSFIALISGHFRQFELSNVAEEAICFSAKHTERFGRVLIPTAITVKT